MKALLSIYVPEKWSIASDSLVSGNTVSVTVTSNTGRRTARLSIVVTPPEGGNAQDIVLLTTEAQVPGTFPVTFKISDSARAGAYAVELVAEV